MSFLRNHVIPLLRETFAKWSSDNCTRLGASLSYYTILSLFPLILVILSVVGMVLQNSDNAREAILASLSQITGGFRQEFVDALNRIQEARRTSGIIGLVTLVLGASWVFGELASAFNIIWGVKNPADGGPMEFLKSTFFSFALVFSVAFLLLVALIFNTVLTYIGTLLINLPGGTLLWQTISFLINILVLSGLFAMLFKYLPRVPVPWRDVWPGAVLTALLWNAAQWLIGAYITWSHYSNYGAIGAIMALVVWVYLSSQILFIGGEFTSVYSRRYGSLRMLNPDQPPAPRIPATSTEAQ